MSEGAYEVHGLSMDDLAALSGGQYFEDKADELLELFNSATCWWGITLPQMSATCAWRWSAAD